MIIRSIRLKHIKSYGEGPDGNGITVAFESGINRIAGKNGHGKSTLIESLGYALFLTKPIFEEGFDAATYLLRSGQKAGEIDVTFDLAGQQYRLERGLGVQNKRRSKVVLLSDGSIEAEGDQEVARYLCRLCNFPDEARLSELFSKLIGVKQGRLAWPFDSKPSDARRHFEPLLDVEVFRDCFEKLKPVLDRFQEIQALRERECSVIDERIRERADSQEKVRIRQQEVETLQGSCTAARTEKEAADKAKQRQEQLEDACRDAKSALDAALKESALARLKKEEDHARARESEIAAEVVANTRSAYEVHQKAETSLRKLQAQQTERASLQNARAAALQEKAGWEGKANAARGQAAACADEWAVRTSARTEAQQRIAERKQALAGSKEHFDARSSAVAAGRQAFEAIQHWVKSVAGCVQENAARLESIVSDWARIAAWDGQALGQAKLNEEGADRRARELSIRLAELRQLKRTLSEQLTQIRGGICPFLNENCRQFDAAKIQSDVSLREQEILQVESQARAAARTHADCRLLAEKLAAEEAKLLQLRKAVDSAVNSVVASHNRLVPATVIRDVQQLREFFPHQAERLPVHPPELAVADECYDPAGTNLEVPVLRRWIANQTAYCDAFLSEWDASEARFRTEFERFEEAKLERLRAERDLEHQQQKLAELEGQIQQLTAKIEGLKTQAAAASAQAQAKLEQLAQFEARLNAYADLDRDLTEQQRIKDETALSTRKFLAADPIASHLQARVAALKATADFEMQAALVLQQKEKAFETSKSAFDPVELAASRTRAEQAGTKLAREELQLASARGQWAHEQQRFAEWQTACLQREKLLVELGRLRGCLELTSKARTILPKAAAIVAQQLCQRIASRAQQLFNQINAEPVELEWSAERYSLRIHPGERRFAMLSGGEQTKLALTMVLAMIQEFSGLKFCVFDEPTYAVDAESRHKLAGAILQLQKLSHGKLEQLLLVSHDDAFEGKIENVVWIEKSAKDGSVVRAR